MEKEEEEDTENGGKEDNAFLEAASVRPENTTTVVEQPRRVGGK